MPRDNSHDQPADNPMERTAEKTAELFQELSERLGRFLPGPGSPPGEPSDDPESHPNSLFDDPDNPVILPGNIADSTGREPDELAREVMDNLDDDGDDELLDVDTPEPLPLLARMRSRGLFEDDWRARPTETHPYPVICLHGTGTTKGDWMELGGELRQDGFAVFAPDFGNRATDSIQESAAQISAYIDAVMQVTGARKIILIGHSQGGTLCRYWMRMMGGAEKVHHLVCLAVPNHGTTLGGIVSPLVRTAMGEEIMNALVNSWFGPSGFEQVTGHKTITTINEGGDLEPGVGYTNIATRGDTVIQPSETCFLYPDDVPDDAPLNYSDEQVTNLWVQDIHPRAVLLHNEMPQDSRVRRIVRQELLKHGRK